MADASHVSVTPDVLLPEQPVRERTRRRVVREAVVKGGQGESEPEDQDIDVTSDGDEMDVDILGPEEDEEDSTLGTRARQGFSPSARTRTRPFRHLPQAGFRRSGTTSRSTCARSAAFLS